MIKRFKRYFIRLFDSDKNNLHKKTLKDDYYKLEMTNQEVRRYFKHIKKDQKIYLDDVMTRYDAMRFIKNKLDIKLMDEIALIMVKMEIDEKLYKYYTDTVYVNSGQPKKYITDSEIRNLIEKKTPIKNSELNSFHEYIDLKHNRNIVKILKEFDKCRLEKKQPDKDLIEKALKLIKHIELEIMFKQVISYSDLKFT